MRPELVPNHGEELDAQTRASVDGHLATCPSCRDEANGLYETGLVLQRALITVEVPPGMEMAALDRVRYLASGDERT